MDEITELREILEAKGIEWEDASDDLIQRTHFVRKDGMWCSVIWGGRYSIGGTDGLLESMPPVHREPDDEDDDVEGGLTAKEIVAAWL